MPPKAAKAKKGAPTPSPKRQKKPVTKESSDEDSSDDADDSDEEVAVVKKPVKGANGKANGAPAADSDDSGDSEESDSEDEKPKAKSAKRKATPAKPQSAKKTKKEESSEESESESEDEKPAKVAATEESDSEEDDSEEEEETKQAESDEDSEDESDDGSDDEDAEVGKKRKGKDSTKAAKKAKVEVPTVIVNNLPEDIADKKVKKFFEKKGISVKEIRKNQNKNFCHIDLEDASQMDAALALDGEELKGSAIKVAKASAKGAPANFDEMPKAQKDKVSLFVKNLPEDATEDSVKDHFDGCVEIKMPTKPDGSNRGFAILFFPEESDVESAMENKQGSDLDGSALLLDYCGDKSNKKTPNKAESRPKSTAEAGQTKVLFVKNLSYDTDEDSLRQAFEGCVGARVATFQDSGKPRGFGFVDFASEADAKAAFDSMNGADLDGREIKLDFATERGGGGDRGGRGGGRGRGFGGGGGGYGGGRGGGRDFGSRPPSEKSNTLFVGNLSFDTDKDSLESAFDGCKTARVATFPDSGKPRGFGYVEFDSENAAESAFKSMKDHEIDGRAIRLDYSAPRGDGGGRGGGRGGRGGFGGGRGGGGFGGRGGGYGGRGGGRGFGDRGGGRGGRGGRGGFVQKKDGIRDFAGKKKTFDD